MYATSVNYYIPRHTVVVYQGPSTRRYQIVYSKNLKLHKGVDNTLQFQFLNQEQKPIDISNQIITCRILNKTGQAVLLQKTLTLTLPLTGIATLTATDGDLSTIDAQQCFYSLTMSSDNITNNPVFVNDVSGGRGVMEIIDSILPKHMPSDVITIPTHPVANGVTQTYNSSVYATTDKSLFTIQTYFTNFTGNIQVQGSILGDSDWYNVTDTNAYSTETGTDYYTIEGYHPFLRLQFVSSLGSADNILIR